MPERTCGECKRIQPMVEPNGQWKEGVCPVVARVVHHLAPACEHFRERKSDGER